MLSGSYLIYGSSHMVQNDSHGGMLSDAQQRNQKYWVSCSTLSLIYWLASGSSFFWNLSVSYSFHRGTKMTVLVSWGKGRYAIHFFGWKLFTKFKGFLWNVTHPTFFFSFSFFFIVVGFVIHWHESAMGLHVFPIPIPPPTSLSTRSL